MAMWPDSISHNKFSFTHLSIWTLVTILILDIIELITAICQTWYTHLLKLIQNTDTVFIQGWADPIILWITLRENLPKYGWVGVFPNLTKTLGWVGSQIWDKFPKNWTYKKIDKFHSPKCFRWTLPVRAISIFFFINFVVHIRTRKRQYKRFWRDAYHTYVRQNQNAPASNNSLLDIVSNLSPPNIWESGKRWGATKEFRSFYY